MQNRASDVPMTWDYVMDSYALLAYLEAEYGGKRVHQLLSEAEKGRNRLFMCVVNLGEVLYIVERERGLHKAQEVLARIDELPVDVIDADRTITLAAAHLKKSFPIAYADCFAAALAHLKNAVLVTGDPEFKKIEAGHNIRIEWLDERTV